MREPRREYLELLGIAFMVRAEFSEDYPETALESRREFFREVRKGAARLYRGRRAHEMAPVEEATLFSSSGSGAR